VSSQDRGLLARLDTLVELVADRHGLALLPDSRLAAAEVRVAAQAAELAAPRGNRSDGLRQPRPNGRLWSCCEPRAWGCYGSAVTGWRRPACAMPAQIDATLRAGLTFAAWCHRVP
jgi:hypothetical protein